MATYAVVDDASYLIVNRIVLDVPGQWTAPAGHTAVEETTGPMDIGGTYAGGVYTPPPAPPPLHIVPPQITSRQFWTKMAVNGLIDEAEAVDAIGGKLPNDIKQFINNLPVGQRFVARTFFVAPTFERNRRAATDMAACFSLTAAAVDLFFQQAAAL